MPEPPSFPGMTMALCFALILLIPLAAAGLALINTGLARSRSAAHLMMSSLCVFSVASIVFFLCGFAWQGYPGGTAYAFHIHGHVWNWIGAQHFLFRGLALSGSPASLVALFGMLSAGLAALIPLGSGADRWRLGPACVSAALLAGWTFPLFAHWVWGGGWLAQLGASYGLGQGFLDAGGAGAIQVVGGLTALSITWIMGPRRGKYTHDGMPEAIPGHNAVFVLFGCVLALIGWWGLNSAGAILFDAAAAGQTVLIAINTALTAAASALAAAATTHMRFGKPDASLTANGWIGGLVASSAASAVLAPFACVIIGAVAGILVALSVEYFESRMSVDDPGGSVSAHAVGGLWGILAVAFFAWIPESALQSAAATDGGHSGQWLAQLVGIATLIGFVLPMTYGLNWILNRFYRLRVTAEGERQGLDLYELGAGAYPELLTHGDEFTYRGT